MTLADKIVIMNGGHIQQVGAPRVFRHDPVNPSAAGSIELPTMNLSTGPALQAAGSGNHLDPARTRVGLTRLRSGAVPRRHLEYPGSDTLWFVTGNEISFCIYGGRLEA